MFEPFPLITFKKKGGLVCKESFPSWDSATIPKPVLVKGFPSSHGLLEIAVNLCKEGAVVLWIENTVQEAQSLYDKALSFLPKESLGLLHSRYTRYDRDKAEKEWIDRLGTEAKSREACILISTQVCEQSVDIDADALFTSLCPSDMMLQRIGRMWRHRKNDKLRKVSDPVVYWYGGGADLLKRANKIVDKKSLIALKKDWGKSSYVYDLHTLCKSAEIWRPITKLNLPQDLRKIIEDTYAI